MFQILEEDDFAELPDDPAHKWLVLERRARGRMNLELAKQGSYPPKWLKAQYVNVVSQLADECGVQDIPLYGEDINETQFSNFELKVSRAQARIWSAGTTSWPPGMISLPRDTKAAILKLSSEIEFQIDKLSESDKRKAALHNRLEDFRREVNQPRTSVAQALASLAQVSTIVAMTTTTVAQADEAIANILSLFGSAYSEINGTEIQLIEHERRKLIEAAETPKLIEGPKSEISGPQ